MANDAFWWYAETMVIVDILLTAWQAGCGAVDAHVRPPHPARSVFHCVALAVFEARRRGPYS